MKKIVLIVAAMVAGLSLSAQQKGDMYVSGVLNLGLNSNTIASSSSTTIGDETTKGSGSTVVNLFNFGIAPKFGYFVADNLEVNVALKYNLGLLGTASEEIIDGVSDKEEPTNNLSNTFLVTPGVTYHLPMIGDKFYYTPSFGLGLGFNANTTKTGNYSVDSDPTFAFGMFLDFLAFEYRLNSNMGLTMSVGGLGYTLATDTTTETTNVAGTEIKTTVSAATHTVDFGFDKVALGFKYYF